MAKFSRRFSRDEFRKELLEHLRDIPTEKLRRDPKALEKIVDEKAERYEAALKALDSAAERLRKLAAGSDAETQQEAENAIREIEQAVNAYGEASLIYNSSWAHESTK